MHKSLNEFEFRPDPTTDQLLTFLERLKNPCHHFFSVAIDQILFKLGMRSCIISWMFLNFDQIGPPAA